MPSDKKAASDKTAKKTKKKPASAARKKAPGKKAKVKAAAPKGAEGAVTRAPLAGGTYFLKPGDLPERWRLIDATDQVLGRLSTRIVDILRGKDKPQYTPWADAGDFVVVINAEKVKLTGNKLQDKVYYYHTNYAGGIKSTTAREMLEKHPERVIENAVWRMMPKSRGHMARKWFKKLKVYAGTEHPHKAQNPVPVALSAAQDK